MPFDTALHMCIIMPTCQPSLHPTLCRLHPLLLPPACSVLPPSLTSNPCCCLLPARRRVVLAACLHALKNPSEPNYTVASRFLAQRLLAAPGAAAAAPAGPADSSGDEVMQDASDSGLTAGLSGDPPADAQQQQQGSGAAERPLAARVLGSLPAKDQAWVRSHVEKWSKGGCFLFPEKLVPGELLLLFCACLIARLRLQFCQPEPETCLSAPPAGYWPHMLLLPPCTVDAASCTSHVAACFRAPFAPPARTCRSGRQEQLGGAGPARTPTVALASWGGRPGSRLAGCFRPARDGPASTRCRRRRAAGCCGRAAAAGGDAAVCKG